VRPQSWQLGASAAELLLEQIGRRGGAPPREIVLENELILRATAGPARQAD
jgi:DNA-binding LacI/PurR family transcriptional regulator